MLVDVEDAGMLDLVIVDGGSIIFACNDSDPSHTSVMPAATRTTKTFGARYIFINEGTFEVGSED